MSTVNVYIIVIYDVIIIDYCKSFNKANAKKSRA